MLAQRRGPCDRSLWEKLERERFESLVAKAIEDLPQEFLDMLENVDIVVEDYPNTAQLSISEVGHHETLLGLYEGVPQTRRTSGYNMVLPDKITMFQKPIEARCSNEDQVYAKVKKTLQHEIAHHFGISDERLREIEGR